MTRLLSLSPYLQAGCNQPVGRHAYTETETANIHRWPVNVWGVRASGTQHPRARRQTTATNLLTHIWVPLSLFRRQS